MGGYLRDVLRKGSILAKLGRNQGWNFIKFWKNWKYSVEMFVKLWQTFEELMRKIWNEFWVKVIEILWKFIERLTIFEKKSMTNFKGNLN